MALCVVGHLPWEINCYTWFAIEGGSNITAQVVLTNSKRSPLTQGGLEIRNKSYYYLGKQKESKNIC